ncbi:Serine/threonine-protein phosphatase 5 [Euphorbia peplus]|nr:Serine/threonine-protein phosphatase 5 [Euphorbia peplus]
MARDLDVETGKAVLPTSRISSRTDPSSSSIPTKVAIAPVAVAVVAAAVILVGRNTAAIVVAVLMVILVVLGACWWVGWRGSGVLTERQIPDLDVEPQYSGARIEGDTITLDFVQKMMDDFKNQKCLHKRYAFQIVVQTRDMLRSLPSLVDISVPNGKHFTVCGDVHGQLYTSLEEIMKARVFVVHGGLFSVDVVKLSDIRAIDRFCEPPEEGLMCELLWSDPQPIPGRGPSKRGVGLSFGGDVTKKFLQENKLDLVVRSHEVKNEGYEIEHDGKLITVFSAPNYCDQIQFNISAMWFILI